MTKQKLLLWISGITIVLVSGFIYYTYAATTTVSLEITGRGIRHGTPENANLGTVMSASGDQEISGQFVDPFRVEDFEGYITGHYTTIQCDGVYGPYGNSLTGVYIKAGNTSPELIQGLTGTHVLINSGLADYTNILTPVTYIYKETNPANAGIINRYGDKPYLKVIIPEGTPPGTYNGTIVFSFYME